jgi:Rrf2 family iron-sulfur cluster assembly transcriptional regulator
MVAWDTGVLRNRSRTMWPRAVRGKTQSVAGASAMPCSPTSASRRRNYLSKTLHALAREGILQSTRGPGGGFQLAKAPAHLTLAEVVQPFLPLEGRACILGRGTCNDRTPCAAHLPWKPVKAEIQDFFGLTTIASLLETERRA